MITNRIYRDYRGGRVYDMRRGQFGIVVCFSPKDLEDVKACAKRLRAERATLRARA